jgi:hypothetical protein
MTLQEFFSIVDSIKPDQNGCLNWPYRKNKYPSVSTGLGKRPHVLVLERKLNRPIKNKYELCHSCDNKICINENHLFEGTKKENSIDCFDKGLNKTAKLNKDQIFEIKNLFQNKISPKEISKIYGVRTRTIRYILSGETWGWLEKPVSNSRELF